MELGNWRLDSIDAGLFWPDGGTMFGIIPKPLWQRRCPADERNRIRSAMNCVLARDGNHTILIDTGCGDKADDRQRERFGLEQEYPLLPSLAALNVSPDEIDLVVLSHLHFDHAGGATCRDPQGRLVPTFPKAKYVVQRREWQEATSGVPELKGAYPQDNFLPLAEAGSVEFLDGDMEIVPGLRATVTGGHTTGHQALIFESGSSRALFPADICPTRGHLPTMWCMAFDVDLLQTRREKYRLIGRAADEGWLVLWDHDPEVVACRVVRDAKREFVAVDEVRRE